jgi:seryl-tRNA synthetase
MLDIRLIRKEQKLIVDEIKKRGMSFDMDSFLALDADRRECMTRLDELRSARNTAADLFPGLSPDEKEKQKLLIKAGNDDIAERERKLEELTADWNDYMLRLPNITHESVPLGPDESGNVVIKTVGEKPVFSFEPRAHHKIPAIEPLIDSVRGAKVSGSRFWYLKGALARLEFALMHYAFDFYAQKGFVPMIPPMLVHENAMLGTGFFPADRSMIYAINEEEDNLYLVGTAEVPLAAYHIDEVVDIAKQPLRYVGYSACFRREAGTYGKDMQGIIRGHQFNKIEMFIFCRPEESWKEHEFLLACSEEFLCSLGLHYQVLNMCTGDIGAPNAKKYDIETWMPGQQAYRETHSCSNDTDFQARRLNCKYVDDQGEKSFVHTLNNTGCADLRMLIALLENYQQEDGSVLIPRVLIPYCGFSSITR